MSIPNQLENGKIALALRSARAAVGWNQLEFAERMGVAKTTIARIETLEMGAKGDFILKAMRVFKEAGVEIDLYSETLSMKIEPLAIANAVQALNDESQRRSDRGVSVNKRKTQSGS